MGKIIQGEDLDINTGDRTIVHCEGNNNNSIDIAFYSILLGNLSSKIDLKTKGSCNLLLELATHIFNNDLKEFCLLDRDYRNEEEIFKKQSNNQAIKFLSFHEVENCLFYPQYLLQLDYIKPKLDENKIEEIIQNIILDKKIHFLADFLQFRINEHLDRFPRINQLKVTELPDNDKELLEILKNKLQINYDEVKKRIIEIENEKYITWLQEFENIFNNKSINKNLLCGKIIFDELCKFKRIFIKPPSKEDIAIDIAKKMHTNNFYPANLKEVFSIE